MAGQFPAPLPCFRITTGSADRGSEITLPGLRSEPQQPRRWQVKVSYQSRIKQGNSNGAAAITVLF